MNLTNSLIGKFGGIIQKALPDHCSMKTMTRSGAKGGPANLKQIMEGLGQNSLKGQRFIPRFRNRILNCYPPLDQSLESHGYIQSSYYKGLNPQEIFLHAMAGRESLVHTATATSGTGYTQRKLIKCLEGPIVFSDYIIRSAQKQIIEFYAGNDCFDPTSLVRVTLKKFLLNTTNSLTEDESMMISRLEKIL
jgi:DNA-directed RNA polymerase beta' subunit